MISTNMNILIVIQLQ